MEREIIIGTGNEQLDAIIQTDLETKGIGRVFAKVHTRRTLVNKVNELGPSLLFIGEELVGESNSKEESEEEWEFTIEQVRRFSYDLRIIFFCDRPQDDIFLTKLTTYSITDIFNEGKLPSNYLEQIKLAPSYKNIERFRGQVQEVSKSLKEKKREEEEKQAEVIISSGAIPKEGKVVEIEVPVYHQLIVKPKLFVFGSAVKGSGSSTFAKMLAEYLASLQLQVGVLESPYIAPSLYDLINAQEYISDDWTSMHELIQDDKEIRRGMSINIEGVTYIPQNPRVSLKNWNLMKSAYLVGYARQIPILLYDISNGVVDEREKLILRQANGIFLTTMFDPARVRASNHSMVSYLLEHNLTDKVTMLSNHSNDYLEKKYSKDLKEAYFDTDDIHFFPHIEEVKNATMDVKSVWSFLDEEQLQELTDTFSQIASQAIGKELFEKL
jgi:hypothetical protein